MNISTQKVSFSYIFFTPIMVCCVLLLFSTYASGSGADQKIYKVGVYLEEPIAMYKDDTYSGIGIDLWRSIARTEHIKYKFIASYISSEDALKALEDKK